MKTTRVLIALAGAAAQVLSGCGWTPLYADIKTEAASEELRAIKVDPIAERIGQRLEIALHAVSINYHAGRFSQQFRNPIAGLGNPRPD